MSNTRKSGHAVKWLCIALVVILIGSLGAMALQTSGGTVKIRELNILTSEQQYLHAQAYIPQDASSTNKYPVVITAHGWLNTLEMQDAACIELSRRGAVVIAIDMYGHGLSGSNSESIPGGANGNNPISGLGMIPMVEYVASGIMDFVDTSRIGIMGHSMGAQGCCYTIRHYGEKVSAALAAAADPASDGGAEITEAERAAAEALNPVSACLATGVSPDAALMPDYSIIHCNLGFLHGAIEEAGRADATGSGEAMVVGGTDEILRLVQSTDASVTAPELGKMYGDKDAGTLRVMYRPYSTHPLIHLMPNCTEDVVEFFVTCLDLDTELSHGSHTYLLKEFCNLIAMVGLFMLLIPLTDVLLSCPCFASQRGQPGPKMPALTDGRKKKFWIGWGVSAALSGLAAWLAITVNGPIMGFSGAIASEMTNHAFFGKFFSSPTTNCIAFWTLMMAVVGAASYAVKYIADKKAGVAREEMLGLKISLGNLGKSVLLTAAVVGIFYVVVYFCKWMFNTDFRFWTPAIKTFKPGTLVYLLQYLPIFFAFYLINSMTVNSENRIAGMSEKKSMLISAFGNVLGAGVLCLIQYGSLLINGYVIWADEWIGVLVIGLALWQLFLAPFLLRKFYNLTGKNWVGALVVSTIYVLSTVANTYLCSAFLV